VKADLIAGIRAGRQLLDPCHPRPNPNRRVAGRQQVELQFVTYLDRLVGENAHTTGADVDRTAPVVEQA